MRTVIIVQARMTSYRLPGKVLKTIQGKPLIGYLLERLARCQRVDQVVVAATNNESDEPIEAFCRDTGVAIYRGDEHDVLRRYYHAAKEYQADVVVRVTADCPLLDPAVIDFGIETFEKTEGLCYLSNTVDRSYPRGMDTELFTFAALETAHKEATAPYEREHVTPYIVHHPEQFQLSHFGSGREGLSIHRWTVDEQNDFDLIRKILEALYPVKPEFTMDDVLELFEKHPEWIDINAHVNQKIL